MKKRIILSSMLLLFALLTKAQSGNHPAVKQHQVIMHLSSSDTLVWKGLMNNIRNLKNAWADSITIEVVAHGPGVDFLTAGKTTQQEKIAFYRSKGVVFVACENTLAERKIPKENIIPEAGFVKMAAAEIILKQEQGWSYMKAGF